MHTDELPPGGGRLACGSGWDIVALEDVPHRLVAHRIAQVSQRPDNTVIAPRAVRAGHADHQVLARLINTGTAYRLGRLRGGHLLVGKLAMPSQHGVRRSHGSDLYQRLFTELGPNLSTFCTFAVAEPHTTVDLLTQDTILSDQRVITQPQVVVHRL